MRDYGNVISTTTPMPSGGFRPILMARIRPTGPGSTLRISTILVDSGREWLHGWADSRTGWIGHIPIDKYQKAMDNTSIRMD